MTIVQIFQTLIVVGMMGVGQLLFKFAAGRIPQAESYPALIVSLLLDPWFLCARAVYCLTTFLWVFILRGAPLSTAYPFVAVAVVAVPLASVFIFGEPFSWRLVLGLAFVVAGLLIASTK
jgi:drug/metabolite transporter (DMT)-like permease